MSRVISVHEYNLKPGVDDQQFEDAILDADKRGVLKLPGLVDYFLVKGIRGIRKGKYAAVWVWESLEAWENLWGPINQPISKADFPQNWKVWENEVLLPLLDQDPDRINYTAYREL